MTAHELMAAPPAVRRAFWLWVGAVAAGAVETVAVVAGGDAGSGGDVAVGVGVRCLAYAGVLASAFFMLRGHRWARLVLALGLGIFGTLSLIVGPIEWLADGNDTKTLFAGADGWWWAAALARAGHIAAVWGGVVLMFTAAANRYFRK
jgi:hypothetical protein